VCVCAYLVVQVLMHSCILTNDRDVVRGDSTLLLVRQCQKVDINQHIHHMQSVSVSA